MLELPASQKGPTPHLQLSKEEKSFGAQTFLCLSLSPQFSPPTTTPNNNHTTQHWLNTLLQAYAS